MVENNAGGKGSRVGKKVRISADVSGQVVNKGDLLRGFPLME